MQPRNIINTTHNEIQIYKAIRKGLSTKFNKSIKNIKNPYGKGNSSHQIIKILKKINFQNFNTQKKITY